MLDAHFSPEFHSCFVYIAHANSSPQVSAFRLSLTVGGEGKPRSFTARRTETVYWGDLQQHVSSRLLRTL